MTHKLQNNYTKEILTLLGKFWDPQQISQPGDLAKGPRTPIEFNFGGQWDLITELTQDWGSRLLEGTHKIKLVCTRTQEKGAVTPQETDSGMPESVQESTAEVWVSGGLLQGRGH